jgi:hypothetical protein
MKTTHGQTLGKPVGQTNLLSRLANPLYIETGGHVI